MTTAADDPTVEDAFEAILAGRPAPRGAAGLAAFTEAVRTTANSPGRPNAALADLLASGLLVDQSSPSARTARSAGATPSRASRSRIRRRTAMFFPAILAKLLSAGAVAQAATGATVVVVAFAGAGAVGVLPGPVQDTFTAIVSDETEVSAEVEAPLEEAPVVEAPVEELPVDEAPVADAELPGDADEWATEGPAGFPSFSAWVSFGSENGYTDGAVVSCWAHARNDERKGREITRCGPEGEEPVEAGSGIDDGTEDVVEETPEQPVTVESEQTTQERGGRGNGNGNAGGNDGSNGNGNGNGGNGNGRN